MERTQEQVEDQIAEALSNPGIFPAMTYADGVAEALKWVSGQTETPPMEG